jgi:hypothetical protein
VTPPSDEEPAGEELAAIVAAALAAWSPAEMYESEVDENRWRFSGRWWARPVAARRDRPWVRPGA